MCSYVLIPACLPAFGGFLRNASPGSLHSACQCLVMTADGWILLQSTTDLHRLLSALEWRLQAQQSPLQQVFEQRQHQNE